MRFTNEALLDAEVARCRVCRDAACDAGHDGEEQWWEARIDTLRALLDAARPGQAQPEAVTR